MSAVAYHGTPITPRVVLEAMGERDYCVSHFRPDDLDWIEAKSRSYFYDNGVFSFWMAAMKSGGEVVMTRDYLDGYYAACRRICLEGTGRCKWVVIPDPIGTGTQELDALLREWPAELADYGVPVFHLDEPIDRLLMLLDRYGRVCIGATAEYRVILSPAFCERMDEAFDAILARFKTIPPVHMFRGLQLLKPSCPWPISSADSTDRARNHNRLKHVSPLDKSRRKIKTTEREVSEIFQTILVGDRPPSEHYLWAVRQSVDRWDRMAANRTQAWPPAITPSLFGEAA